MIMKKIFTLILLAVCVTVNEANAQIGSLNMRIADRVTLEGKEYILGKNMVENPQFNIVSESNEITGWTVGTYAAMTTSNFNWYSTGGHDGGAYIKARSHNGAAGAGSVAMKWPIEPAKKYYFRYWLKNNSVAQWFWPVLSITDTESTKGGQNEYTNANNHGKTLVGQNGDDPDPHTWGYSNADNGEWCLTSVIFDSTDEDIEATFLQFNARWLNSAIAFDDFYLGELLDPETIDVEELEQLAAESLREELIGMIQSKMSEAVEMINEWTEYPALGDELYDVTMEEPSSSDPTEDLQAFYDKLTAAIDYSKLGYEAAQQLLDQIKVAQNYLQTTNFPLINELSEALQHAEDFDTEREYNIAQDYINELAKLTQAIEDYIASQNATPETPADYSHLIQHRFFVNTEAEPSINVAGAYIYPNGANYNNGSKPSDANSEGWYIGESGGDQRVNYVQGRSCWNAWKLNFGTLSISQNLTNLPNGYYKVSADFITQAGCITNQHLFVTSSYYTVDSPSMTIDGWQMEAPYDGTWETLTTGIIVVTDGKLTIGAKGDSDNNYTPSDFGGTHTDKRRGWFCVTNFKLYYMGPASNEDLAQLYQDQLNVYKAELENVKLAADYAGYKAVIDTYPQIQNEEEMITALSALTEAQKTAQQSINAYGNFVDGVMKTLQDAITNGEYTGEALSVAQAVLQATTDYLNSKSATYTELSGITASINAYLQNYLPALIQVTELKLTDDTAKEARHSLVNSHLDIFTNILELPDASEVNAYAAELNEAYKVFVATELVVTGGDDYTSLIVNPTIDDNKATGWTVNRIVGDGNNAKSGQQFDGNKSGFYMDSYNATAGLVRYTAYQTVKNIPNGIYHVGVMNRVTGENGKEGVYVFAYENDSEITFEPVHHEWFNYKKWYDMDMIGGLPVDDEGNEIEEGYIQHVYGSVWEEAAQWVYEHPTATSGIYVDVFSANNNTGWGWMYTTLEFEVKNHEITFGITTDYEMTQGHIDTKGEECVPFSGTWFSADNWTLTLVSSDDKSYNPSTDINTIETSRDFNRQETNVIYDLSGRLVKNISTPGLYIVNGKKVMVK